MPLILNILIVIFIWVSVAFSNDYSVFISRIYTEDSSLVKLKIGFGCSEGSWIDTLPFYIISNNDTVFKSNIWNSNTVIFYQQSKIDSTNLRLLLDPGKTKADQNYSNNFISKTFYISDYKIPDFVLMPASEYYVSNNEYKLYFKIVSYNGKISDSIPYIIKTNGVVTKSSKSKLSEQFEVPITVYDSIKIEFEIDPENTKGELIKSNNISRYTYYPRNFIKNIGIDLGPSLSSLDFSSDSKYHIIFGYNFVGLPKTDTVQSVIYLNNQLSMTSKYPDINSDQCIDMINYGSHDYVVIMDPSNLIPEYNELNNLLRVVLINVKGTQYKAASIFNKNNRTTNYYSIENDLKCFNLAGRKASNAYYNLSNCVYIYAKGKKMIKYLSLENHDF